MVWEEDKHEIVGVSYGLNYVDYITIVKCKDCKWFVKKMFENEGRCIKHDNEYHAPDWFCADGSLNK